VRIANLLNVLVAHAIGHPCHTIFARGLLRTLSGLTPSVRNQNAASVTALGISMRENLFGFGYNSVTACTAPTFARSDLSIKQIACVCEITK